MHLAAADLEASLRRHQTEHIAVRLGAFSETIDLVIDSIGALELQRHDGPETRSSAQPIAKAIDNDHIFSLLSELRQLLEEDDFRAVKSLENLKGVLPAGLGENELTVLEVHIEGFAFEKALETLSVVEQTINENLVRFAHNWNNGTLE